MASTELNVAVIGGTGDLGHVIVEQLAPKSKFQVTVVTRNSAPTNLPAGVKTVVADYDALESLINALKGIDAVVNTLPGHLEQVHLRVLDAAIAAGVKRYIPSEFGSDHRQRGAQSIPLSATKIKVDNALQEASSKGLIDYTSILGGPWIEWLMGAENCMSVPRRNLIIHDGGDLEFGLMTRKAFGDAVVGVLEHLEQTKNQVFIVEVIKLTQNRIVELVKEAFPGESFEISHVDTLERYERGVKRLFAGEFDISIVTDIVSRYLFDPELTLSMDTEESNKLLRVKRITEEDFKKIIQAEDQLLK